MTAPRLPGAPTRRPLVGGEVRRTTLPGGLRVVTEAMPASRTFSVGCFVDVGSRTETAELHGASHFLEHVLFKGTPSRTAEQISRSVESVGGDLNAYTAKEHTCFYARVLADDAELAVDVLVDMLTHSLITGADVEAEREVILDEIAMHHDDPAEATQELVTGALFGDAGLGRPVIGSVASIRGLRPGQVQRYWRRHYVAPALVVAAAGAVDHERLVAQLAAVPELASAHDTGRAGHGARVPTSITASPGVVVGARELEQTTACLALPAPGMFDDRRYPLGLLGLVVGGGMSSRLFLEVRERRGLAYGIEAGDIGYTDAGVFSVDWQCAPERLLEIAGIVRATLADVAERGVSEAELDRSKTQMRGQTVLGYEGPGSRMSRLGSAAIASDERSVDEVLDRYDAVGVDDVRQAAQDLFVADPVLAVVGPRLPWRRVDSVLRHWRSA